MDTEISHPLTRACGPTSPHGRGAWRQRPTDRASHTFDVIPAPFFKIGPGSITLASREGPAPACRRHAPSARASWRPCGPQTRASTRRIMFSKCCTANGSRPNLKKWGRDDTEYGAASMDAVRPSPPPLHRHCPAQSGQSIAARTTRCTPGWITRTAPGDDGGRIPGSLAAARPDGPTLCNPQNCAPSPHDGTCPALAAPETDETCPFRISTTISASDAMRPPQIFMVLPP